MTRLEKFQLIFLLSAGICIPALWVYLLSSGVFARLGAEPVFSAVIISADFLTAILALAAGLATLVRRSWAGKLRLIAVGMIFYAVLIASGEFLQLRHAFFSVVFIVLAVLSAVVVLLTVKMGR